MILLHQEEVISGQSDVEEEVYLACGQQDSVDKGNNFLLAVDAGWPCLCCSTKGYFDGGDFN